MRAKKIYKFKKPKNRSIICCFSREPGRWYSTGTTDMTEAILWAENKLNGTVTKKDLTLKEFAYNFFKEEDPHGLRKRNERRHINYPDIYYSKRQSRLENWILPAHGNFLLTAINDVLIEDFILDIPRADDTKNKILMTYRLVLDAARREGYVSENFAERVKMLNCTDAKKREPFTDKELSTMFPDNIENLIKIWHGLQWAGYFLILKDTGFRPGEAAGLAYTNYYKHLHGIYTTASVDAMTGHLKNSIKTTKKGQAYKLGLLSPITEKVLQEIINQFPNEEYFFKLRHKGSSFLKAEISNKHLKWVLKELKIDLKGRSQYCFRHTFDSNLLGKIPKETRLELMGHTAERPEYLHVSPEERLKRLQDKQKEKDSH